MELRIYFFRYRNNNCGGTILVIPGVSLSNLGTYSIYKIIINWCNNVLALNRRK